MRIFVFNILVLLVAGLNGQVLINEFCASNSLGIEDPDYQDNADWLELFNSGDSSINLVGYFLSDNLGSPDKWQITENLILDPGAFVIIWADGMDNGLHTNFKISADGEELALYSPNLQLIDSIVFRIQKSNISYGRSPDGETQWAYFDSPTPGNSNSTIAYDDILYFVPEFSQRGGIYNDSFSLNIYSPFGGEVRYTKDGSEPTQNSILFTSPLQINETSIIRARVFMPGMLPGPVKTQSYFINENSVNGNLPLVSVSTDPGNFWDPEYGIYVQDFKPDWEIPVNIELFENNGLDRAAFNEMAGMKINGLYSWQLPQKMLGIYFRNAYGDGNLSYHLTPQRNRSSYKSFALRASGSDWSYTLFRDLLGQEASLQNMDVDIMGFKPAVLYVNGEYMGIHNIREKVDADYIEKSYGLAKGSFDLVENEDYPEAGNLEAYQHLETLLSRDLSQDVNYNAVAELVDIENFTDLAIIEMAVRNTSIDHNVMCWKPKEGGKWRWVLMDLDRGFFNAVSSSTMVDFFISQEQLLLGELFENQGYKEYFADRLSAQLFTSYNAERMKVLIHNRASSIESEVERHIQRWQGTTSSYGDAMPSFEFWQNEVKNLENYAIERPASLLANMRDYNFNGIAWLTLSSFPSSAANFKIQGLNTFGDFAYGPWIRDREFEIVAEDKAGYTFTGWYELSPIHKIRKGSDWKYDDTGNYPGDEWIQGSYNDDNWPTGTAPLGYGNDGELTSINYGNSSNKFPSAYFRNSFNISQEEKEEGQFFIQLRKDDAAIVYINGEELVRLNLDAGPVNFSSLAESSVGGESEDIYYMVYVDREYLHTGRNNISVEVHQASSSSSDLMMDLALLYYIPGTGSLISSDRSISRTLQDDLYLEAAYQKNDECTLQAVIDSAITISTECSPLIVSGDLYVKPNTSLTIEPGVEIIINDGGSIIVEGSLHVLGTEEFPVSMQAGNQSWGALILKNTTALSSMQNLIIEGAERGKDPVLENAAIAVFNSEVIMDHLEISNVNGNPIIARNSDITLTNSTLKSKITGDLINVKYGRARIENSRFYGNNQADTDGVDYDEVVDGVIRNCTFTDFHGFNSDAIDIGEQAENVLIDSVIIYCMTDKGISIGQKSSAKVRNSVIINCNMGVAVKDSSTVTITNSTFYNTGYSVACFEKNIGLSGGNASISNSILTNVYENSFLEDETSSLNIKYSILDNGRPGDEALNKITNPLFLKPSLFNFELSAGSPAIKFGQTNEGTPVDPGAKLDVPMFIPSPIINSFYIDGSNLGIPEFISILNPGDKSIDLSGYAIDKGVTASIPDGTMLGPGRTLYLTGQINDTLWESIAHKVFEWQDGHLSNNGEGIRLVDQFGIVQDNLVYSELGDWPSEAFSGTNVFKLKDPEIDNHFGENWISESLIKNIIDDTGREMPSSFKIYPNPAKDILNIEFGRKRDLYIEIYNMQGQLLYKEAATEKFQQIDLTGFENGFYFIKAGKQSARLVILR